MMMEKVKNWEGCGKCELCGTECSEKDVPVIITVKKDIKWDNWGKMVTAFKKGQIVKGRAVIGDGKVYCASAESTLYGVEDFVDLDSVDIDV